jgi:integrase/recombinase XerC
MLTRARAASSEMTSATALLALWTAHLREERRFSDNSVEAYERDVAAFLGFLTSHLGGEAFCEGSGRTGAARSARLSGASPARAGCAGRSLDFARAGGYPQLLSLP